MRERATPKLSTPIHPSSTISRHFCPQTAPPRSHPQRVDALGFIPLAPSPVQNGAVSRQRRSQTDGLGPFIPALKRLLRARIRGPSSPRARHAAALQPTRRPSMPDPSFLHHPRLQTAPLRSQSQHIDRLRRRAAFSYALNSAIISGPVRSRTTLPALAPAACPCPGLFLLSHSSSFAAFGHPRHNVPLLTALLSIDTPMPYSAVQLRTALSDSVVHRRTGVPPRKAPAPGNSTGNSGPVFVCESHLLHARVGGLGLVERGRGDPRQQREHRVLPAHDPEEAHQPGPHLPLDPIGVSSIFCQGWPIPEDGITRALKAVQKEMSEVRMRFRAVDEGAAPGLLTPSPTPSRAGSEGPSIIFQADRHRGPQVRGDCNVYGLRFRPPRLHIVSARSLSYIVPAPPLSYIVPTPPLWNKKLRKKKKDKAVAPPPSQDVGEGDGEGAEGDWEVTDTPAHSGLDAEASEVISLMAQGSLSNLASQDCQRWRGDTMSGAVSFVSAINYIQLTAKVTSIVRAKKDRPKLTKTRVWELYASKDCKKKTFMGWVNNGTKYAHLAGAGSIYFLMIVAMRGQRSKITSMHWNSISAIANALRCPPAEPETFQNFCENLEDLYGSKGTKKQNTYVTLTDKVIDGHDTLLYGADNSLLAFIAGDMPAEMRDSLERNLRNAFVVEAEEDCVLQPHDSATAEEGFLFPALHFCYYSRNGTRGNTAPTDVHPELLRHKGKSSTNHTQFIPYASQEMKLNERIYENLCNSFEEFFAWIEPKLRRRLPDLYQDLEMVASILPGQHAWLIVTSMT
ncbi:hypothetical protein B0H21DRAFT_825258 [Amylocystis lapponica]|nr:hypothetical protein B0H21DRAFT_825258 [Amylocystis lapponica]